VTAAASSPQPLFSRFPSWPQPPSSSPGRLLGLHRIVASSARRPVHTRLHLQARSDWLPSRSSFQASSGNRPRPPCPRPPLVVKDGNRSLLGHAARRLARLGLQLVASSAVGPRRLASSSVGPASWLQIPRPRVAGSGIGLSAHVLILARVLVGSCPTYRLRADPCPRVQFGPSPINSNYSAPAI
jgi:hypothetical protein